MDVLRRPRLLRMLVELSKKEPMSMTEFMETAGYVQDPAMELRNDMESAKLIVVKEKNEGSRRWKEIWLTPVGRRMAQKGKELDELAEEALKTNGEGYGESSRAKR